MDWWGGDETDHPKRMKERAATLPKKTQAALPSGRTNAAGLPHCVMIPSLRQRWRQLVTEENSTVSDRPTHLHFLTNLQQSVTKNYSPSQSRGRQSSPFAHPFLLGRLSKPYRPPSIRRLQRKIKMKFVPWYRLRATLLHSHIHNQNDEIQKLLDEEYLWTMKQDIHHKIGNTKEVHQGYAQ
jgi:ParB-like chromosome segregation protein Spo0J